MATIYSFLTKSTPLDPSTESNFNGLMTDANHQAMTGVQGSGIQTTDNTGTPQTSPLTVTTTTTLTVQVPLSAVAFNVITATNTLNVSEVSGMASYVTLPIGQLGTFACTRQSTFYLKSNTGSATVSFWFEIV